MATSGSKDKPMSQTNEHPLLDSKPIDPPTKAEQLSNEHLSYLRLMFFLVISIFLAETVAMVFVYELPPLPYQYLTLIDAGIMTILIFPLLYFLSFQPLIRHIEKRYQVEKALQEKEELQATILDSIHVLLAYMDRDFNFIRVNDAYARAEGKTPDYFIGRNHFTQFPDPEKQRIFQQVVESGEPFSVYEQPFEYAEHPERGITYRDWSLQPVKDSNGVVEGLVLSLLDVTERRRAEDSNRQLSRIVEQTEDTVVVTDRAGLIEYVNPAFERLTGYTKQEALGQTPRVIKSREHDPEFYRNLWNKILRGDVFQSEIANRKKNGELFYEVKTITPLRDGQGNITHFVATGKNITQHKLDEEKLIKAYDELEARVVERTEELKVANSQLEKEIGERKQAEEAVRQSVVMLRAVLEQMPSGVTVRDARTGQLIFSNVRSREIMDELVDLPEHFEEYHGFHPDGRPYRSEDWPVYRSIKTGEVINGEEIECARTDGTRFTMVVSSAPIYDVEGNVVNGVAVFHDITERKEVERQIQQYSEELRAANEELIHFNNAMVGRELRMIELKKEVNELCGLAEQPLRYSLDFEKE